MRTTLSLVCLTLLLACATPAQAQLRSDVRAPAPAALYEDASSGETAGLGARVGDLVSTLFSDEHFRMSHSYEMSMSSYGGGSSLGMYTNSMQWQFNDAWAARADVSVAHQPFGGNGFSSGGFGEGQNMRVFLRNAEIAYRPSDNMEVRFQVRQSPYGGYAQPYGYGPRGFGPRQHLFAPSATQGSLFWRSEQRN